MTTRADIAKLAGVSESTVSYVLSGKRPISEKTKQRVLAAIEEAGYKSNYAAAALAGGSPRMVTMMISNLFTTPTSRINGALVDGIVDGVRELGFHSVIWPVSNDDDSDVDHLLRSNFSGGIILMNVKQNDQRVHLLNREKIPFVVLGRTDVGFEYNYVDTDFEAIYRLALTKLRDLGHTHVGVLVSGFELNNQLKTVANSLKVKLFRMDVSNSFEGGKEAAKHFKDDFPQVSAIMSLVDAATIGFVESASQNGLSIPSDISVIALNMLNFQAESAEPKITTISYDAYEMAKSCGKMVVEAIEAGKENRVIKSELWVGDFVDRGSISLAKKESR
jgi:DNA-binding LacI/PurR family transcriptional regulator